MDDFDAFYAALEERFRGPYKRIRLRCETYLRYVNAPGDGAYLGPVLDLGTGRGEWLDLLREHGVPASGIDQNAKFVSEATHRGLEIEVGDIFDLLPVKPSNQYGVVTAFHLIEHLTPQLQLRLLGEIFRILKPGGLLLLEWPNIENIRVATNSFWLDPTHLHPLPADLLCFMVEFVGFSSVTTERFRAGKGIETASRSGIWQRIVDRVVDHRSIDAAIEELNALLTPGVDVALRATKPL